MQYHTNHHKPIVRNLHWNLDNHLHSGNWTMFHLYYVLWSTIRSDRDQLWLKMLIKVNNYFSIMSRKSGKSCVVLE